MVGRTTENSDPEDISTFFQMCFGNVHKGSDLRATFRPFLAVLDNVIQGKNRDNVKNVHKMCTKRFQTNRINLCKLLAVICNYLGFILNNSQKKSMKSALLNLEHVKPYKPKKAQAPPSQLACQLL